MKQSWESISNGRRLIIGTPPSDGQVVLVGPCTPPDGGTTIPFRLLAEYVAHRHGDGTKIFDTHPKGQIYRHKGTSLIEAGCELVSQCLSVIDATRSCSACMINGSPRYLSTAGAAMVAMLSLLRRKSITVYAAGGAFDKYLFGLPFAIRHIVIAALRQADAIVVQTNSSAGALSNVFTNVHVVHNWVEPPESVPEIEPSIRNRPFRFIFAGEVREGKGVWELLEAFPQVSEHLESNAIKGVLDLVGPCKDPVLLSALQDFCGDRSDAIWHGPCSHSRTLELISEADCMVLPTFHSGEGYPGVILEALVRAKPVITCALRPIVELFSTAQASLLIPPRNPNALAEAMISVAESDELRLRLATANLELGQEFSTPRVLPMLCSIAQI